MICKNTSTLKGESCIACGYRLKNSYQSPPSCDGAFLIGDAQEISNDLVARNNQLGDAMENFLTSYGITKEWWNGFLSSHGLPPCNCSANQDWLNDTSDAHPTIANIGVKLLDALKRK